MSPIPAIGPPASRGTELADIDAGASSLAELFSPFDKAPLPRRTLHPDFQLFLQKRALALRRAKQLRIVVHLPPGKREPQFEPAVAIAIRENLRNTGNFLAATTIIALIKAVILFFLGTGLLAPAYFLWSYYNSEPRFVTLLGESIAIGGWVMVWECIYLLVFEISDVRIELKLDRRLEKADIVFADDDAGLTVEKVPELHDEHGVQIPDGYLPHIGLGSFQVPVIEDR